jgi:hypothetical protein
MHTREEHGVLCFFATTTQRCTREPYDLHFFHTIVVHEYSHVYVDYFNYSSTTTSTMSGVMAMPPPASAGSGSTSTMPCAATSCLPTAVALHQLRHTPRLVFSRPQWLYINYTVHPDAPSRRSTSRRLVALALAVRSVTVSRSATTRRPDCIGSTAPMSCIQTRCLDTRFLIGRSHWLSPCIRSLRLATRLLVFRIAPALLRL